MEERSKEDLLGLPWLTVDNSACLHRLPDIFWPCWLVRECQDCSSLACDSTLLLAEVHHPGDAAGLMFVTSHL